MGVSRRDNEVDRSEDDQTRETIAERAILSIAVVL